MAGSAGMAVDSGGSRCCSTSSRGSAGPCLYSQRPGRWPSRGSEARPKLAIPIDLLGIGPKLRPKMKTVLIPAPAAAPANRECALADCAESDCAVVLDLRCPAGDACRLRALGVYEGARVTVVRT